MKIVLIYILMISCFATAFGQQKSLLRAEKKMVLIGKGIYQSFYAAKSKRPITIRAFMMDECAVTNAEFLEFVKAEPLWSRSKVNRLFADTNYLRHWDSDFDIGRSKQQLYNSPVVNVSWFAALAYCRWKKKRLPILAEWELAGSAQPKGQKQIVLTNYILGWCEKPASPFLPNVKTTYCNTYGLYDMHGLIWEWVFDFNSYVVSGDSRETVNNDKKLFCAAGSINVKDRKDYAAFLRYSFRGSLKGNYCITSLGFRCAKDIKQAL